MAAIIHPLLSLLASLSRQELAQQVTYLKTENKILRSKLPARIQLNNQERRRLLKHGLKLGARIKDLISIASYSTFRKWVRVMEDESENRPANKSGKKGRPRVDENIAALIIKMRKETNWGYTKIVAAMRNLGHRVSRQTVKNVLKEAGLGPDPVDHPDTWSDFLKRHAHVMWQCDFACKRKWTIKGMVDLYFLVFIHIETRRIWVSPCTANPTGEWTTQQARNFAMHVEEHGLRCEIIQRDNDAKYIDSLDSVFTSVGARIKRTTHQSPNLQAFVERVVQTLKHEILNAFCIVSNKQLDHILAKGADWYNNRRCHSERDNRPPIRDEAEPDVIDLATRRIECLEELGGQLKSFRAAA